MKRTLISCLAVAMWLIAGEAAQSAIVSYSAAGNTPNDIVGVVDDFRNAFTL